MIDPARQAPRRTSHRRAQDPGGQSVSMPSRTGLGRATASAVASLRLPVRAFVVIPACLATYAFCLHLVYYNFLLEPFRYMGFRYASPDGQITVVCLLAASVAAVALPARLRHPSDVLLWILFAVVIGPFILMSPYLGVSADVDTCIRSIGVAVAFASVALATRTARSGRGLRLRVSPPIFWTAIAVFSAIVYVYLAAVVGISFRFLSVGDVYDVRADYSDALSESRLLGYLVSTQANAVNPLVIAAGLYSLRAVPLLAGIAGQLLLYSSAGFKTILFSVPAILIIGLVFRFASRPSGLKLVWGCTGVVVIALAVDVLRDGLFWSSLLTRRFLIVPARLTGVYLDFYDSHPFHLLGNSVLSPWVQSPYDFAPPRTISIHLTGSPNTAMNANLFADGFAQFGWIGIALISLLLVVYLRLLDRAARGMPTAVAAVVVVMPAITLSNSSLLTSFLSHGLIAALLVIAAAPRLRWGARPRRPEKAPSTVRPPLVTTGTDP